MSSLFRLAAVAAKRHIGHSRYNWFLVIVAALIIQGCAATPQRPLTGPDPADPDVRVPATGYRSALRDFHSA